MLDKYHAYFLTGYLPDVSAQDALVVGLYLGEGTKKSASLQSASWTVTNSDPTVLKLCKAWAERHGVSRFRIKVQVPERDPKTDEEILKYWASELDVSQQDVRVYRKKLVQRTVPVEYSYGTVHLAAGPGATRLYHLWRGQLERLLQL